MKPGPKPTLTADTVRSLRRKFAARRATGDRSRWIKQEAQRIGASHHAVKNAVQRNSYRWVQ